MPVVGIPVKQLRRLVGQDLSNEKVISCCQELGCDVEELTLINRVKCSSCENITEYTKTESLPKSCDICTHEFSKENTDYKLLPQTEVLRLDLLADRPDNFDAGGLSRSMKGYLGIENGLVNYDVKKSDYQVTVDPSMSKPESYRPYITCAVVKNISFNDDSLKNIMKLQENLHWALGRDRKFASIGVYNLDKIKNKINYKSVSNDGIKFVPLGSVKISDEFKKTPGEILKEHPKGMAYAHLLSALKKYPILVDEAGTVLSMPPIINSEDTKVTIDSTDVFIDVTGLNSEVINKALNIMLSSMKEWDKDCEVYSVEVKYPDKTIVTPHLESQEFTIDFENCRKLIGVEMTDDDIISYLGKMRYDAVNDNGKCKVSIPCYRNDIMHEHDIIEDVAIAYGYKNIKPGLIESFTIGNILPKEQKKQSIREVMTGLGFFEVINIMLTSQDRAYEKLGMPIPENCAEIDNPISIEQTIIRTELLSGVIETAANNTNHELPQKYFEVGEVVFADPSEEEGTREEIVFASAIAASKVGFADMKAVIAALMYELDLDFKLEAADLPVYLKGRGCKILINGAAVGHMGELHPEVLERYHINNPVAAAEINMSKDGFIS